MELMYIYIQQKRLRISIFQYMSYYVGDIFDMANFDLRYNVACSTGIHFFMTKEDAIAYL